MQDELDSGMKLANPKMIFNGRNYREWEEYIVQEAYVREWFHFLVTKNAIGVEPTSSSSSSSSAESAPKLKQENDQSDSSHSEDSHSSESKEQSPSMIFGSKTLIDLTTEGEL